MLEVDRGYVLSVQLTEIGLAWLVLGLLAFFKGRLPLLGALVIASVFQAAMVFKIEYRNYVIPIIPYYWIAILIALRLLIDVASGRIVRMPPALKLAGMAFLFFVMYGTLSILLFPSVFEGIPVYDPRKGIDAQYMNLTPLQFSSSMVGQVMYLWINALTLIFAAMCGSRRGALEKFSRYIIWAGTLVVVLAMLQFLAWIMGIPFPYRLLNNAEGWSLGYMQYLGDVNRINGSFTEPSNLAAFLLGFVAFLLRLWAGGGWRLGALLLFSLTALLLTTSTTAYVGLGILLTLYGLAPAVKRNVFRRENLVALGLLLSVLAIGIAGSLMLESVGQVVRAAILEKGVSGSFVHRMAADRRALEIVLETAGFGVGLGGNRPSSFLMWLLSNVGIVGTASFALGMLFTIRAARRGCQGIEAVKGRCLLVSAAVWGLVGHLTAKIISQPDLSFPTLWVWLMFLVTAAAAPGRIGGRISRYVSVGS